MRQNLKFLKNTNFGKWINLQSRIKQETVGNNLQNYYESIEKLEDPFKSLVLKGFGFDGLSAFIANPKLFFKALPNIPKYEAFLDILESVFGSRNVQIKETIDGIDITVQNANDNLKSYYVAFKQNNPNLKLDYIDEKVRNYVGFQNGDYSSLNWFFMHLLKRFVTAGIKVKNLTVEFKEDNSKINLKKKKIGKI